MRFESFPKLLSEEEITEKFKEAREEFKDYYLKEEAAKLRKMGFGVDDECRIKTSEFKSFFGPNVLNNDKEKVESLEKEWNEKAQKEGYESYKGRLEIIKGENLEMAKTLAFNGLWFSKKLIAIRTSRYDDVFNGVDELIFDNETKFPLAAVDVSTDAKDKVKKLFEEKMYKGARIKYGFGFRGENAVEKKSYENLPLFVIPISPEDLLEVNSNIIKGKTSFEGLKISNNILYELTAQSEIAANSSIEPALKAQYQKAGKIFEKL